MIKSAKLNNFKLFESLTIDNISQVTLIGGKNNVGKTSVLEAFFTFFDRGNPEVTLRQMSWRGVNVVPVTPENMWAPIFKDFEMSAPIDIRMFEEKRRERLRINLNTKFKKPLKIHHPDHTGGPAKIKTDQQVTPVIALDFTYYVNGRQKDLTHIVLDQGHIGMHVESLSKSKRAVFFPSGMRNPNEDAERFGQIDIKGDTEDVIEALKIMEPRLTSLTPIPQANISIMHGDIGLKRKVPVPFMGEGTARLLSIIVAIADTKNGIILVDEIENGLHYSVLPDVWKAIFQMSEKYNCQVLLTTHSFEAIKSLQETLLSDEKKRCSYIRLDRVEDEIVPKYYDPDMLLSAFEQNWEIR